MSEEVLWPQWKELIDDALTSACIRIIREPLLYFSEADLQQFFVEALRAIEPLSKLYPTGVPTGKDAKSVYKTSLIHREYGGEKGRRIDISIFSPEDVALINTARLLRNNRYLKPVFAIELGTEKTIDTSAHLENDLRKLQDRVEGTGYIIHFYKDTSLSRSGTLTRQSTEAKIERIFKEAFASLKDSSNIKIIAILLRTFRNQKKMWGKCEIFNGAEWEKTGIQNDTDLRSAILRRMD